MNEGVERVLAEFGRIDVLVNNAGYGLTGPIEALTRDAGTPVPDQRAWLRP